jgi:hypothetical protein
VTHSTQQWWPMQLRSGKKGGIKERFTMKIINQGIATNTFYPSK